MHIMKRTIANKHIYAKTELGNLNEEDIKQFLSEKIRDADDEEHSRNEFVDFIVDLCVRYEEVNWCVNCCISGLKELDKKLRERDEYYRKYEHDIQIMSEYIKEADKNYQYIEYSKWREETKKDAIETFIREKACIGDEYVLKRSSRYYCSTKTLWNHISEKIKEENKKLKSDTQPRNCQLKDIDNSIDYAYLRTYDVRQLEMFAFEACIYYLNFELLDFFKEAIKIVETKDKAKTKKGKERLFEDKPCIDICKQRWTAKREELEEAKKRDLEFDELDLYLR